jgi:uncharacterized lipoprotein YmbA
MAVLAGCATAPPAPTEYLLRPSLTVATDATEQSPDRITLRRVSVAPYLEREGIVIETRSRQIQAARAHRWSEPLSRSLRRMLQVGIARASGSTVVDAPGAGGGEVVVDVAIHQLHGSIEGEVVLVADWHLRDGETGALLQSFDFSRRVLTEESGYDALVAAHVELIEQLSGAIAQSLAPLR